MIYKRLYDYTYIGQQIKITGKVKRDKKENCTKNIIFLPVIKIDVLNSHALKK